MENEQFSLTLIVENHPGMLTRISGLFSRRGFNIDFLSVAATNNPKYSIMYIVAMGNDYVKGQMVKQLEKLHDVKKVALLEFSINEFEKES